MPAKHVPAVFHDPATKQNVAKRMLVATSLGSLAHAAMLTCSDHAWDNGYSFWAHEDPVSQEWLAFKCGGRSSRVFLKRLPTQEAAEMWLAMCSE